MGLVRIHDDYVDVDLVTDKYRVCRASKKILSKDDISPFGGDELKSRRGGAGSIDTFSDNLI
jgi:hypothetical protein